MEKRNEEINGKFEVMQETIDFLNKSNERMDELSDDDLKDLDRIKISLILVGAIQQSAVAAAAMAGDLQRMLLNRFNEVNRTKGKSGNPEE